MSIRTRSAVIASVLLLGILATPAPAQLYGVQQPYGFGGAAIAPGGGMAAGMLYGGAINPYTAMAASAASNPYSSYNASSSGSGYNPFMYPYYGQGGIFGREGGALYGAAQVISAYGQALNAQEQSRIMREQYYQAALDTQRKRFDLAMYIRANTPSFTDEQANVSRNTLRRVQINANPAEIATGKALNLLLDDASRFGKKRPELDEIRLTPDVLKQLNITKTGNGVGVLRNDGKINWPIALADVLTNDQRKAMSLQAQNVVRDAAKGNLDPNLFKDLRTEINNTRDQLLKRVNDVPGEQYMQAKRFLSDLESSLQAVQQGEMQVHSNFDSFVAGKSRTVQELVDFLTANGYRFAPGTQGDEASYRALYSALANYDVALNAQFNSEPREKQQQP